MLDNAIFAALVATLNAGLATQGVEAKVLQSYQPTTQGVEVGPALYFTKMGPDRRRGWPQRSDEWNLDHTEFTHTERQNYETTVKFAALVKEAANDTMGLTASDLVNIAAAILQGDPAMVALAEAGLTVLRIGQIQNGKIVDGEGQFETVPTFDFVILHEQVTVTITPVALVKDLRIYRV